jgi:hypothetical protein
VRTKAAAARRISRMTMAGAPAAVVDAPLTSAPAGPDLNGQRPGCTTLGPPASA